MSLSHAEATKANLAALIKLVDASNPIRTEYSKILSYEIPLALQGLERVAWKGGKRVIVAPKGFPRIGIKTQTLSVWRLTATIYLTSNGLLAIKVLDPLQELGYELVEVGIDYLVFHHSNRRTRNKLHYELKKLAESEPSDS